MAETLDEGLALFAGLNVIPKRSSLSEYSCRADPGRIPAMMDRWHAAITALDVPLGAGGSFDLDFHTIPYHGDDALIQKPYVSKRSRLTTYANLDRINTRGIPFLTIRRRTAKMVAALLATPPRTGSRSP